MTIISEILGTDSFSGSRITINANFQSLKSTCDSLETNFGLSISAGNIDISTASGGSIKSKSLATNSISLPASGVPKITFTGSTGNMTGVNLTLSGSLTVPSLTVDNLTCSNLGSSVFNGEATFNQLVKINDGLAMNMIDIGTVSSHTVLNSDRVVVFQASGSPASFSVTADPSLVNGHVVTLISKGSSAEVLNTTNVLGFSTGSVTFSAAAYKSSITLMWVSASSKWLIVESSNITIV